MACGFAGQEGRESESLEKQSYNRVRKKRIEIGEKATSNVAHERGRKKETLKETRRFTNAHLLKITTHRCQLVLSRSSTQKTCV